MKTRSQKQKQGDKRKGKTTSLPRAKRAKPNQDEKTTALHVAVQCIVNMDEFNGGKNMEGAAAHHILRTLLRVPEPDKQGLTASYFANYESKLNDFTTSMVVSPDHRDTFSELLKKDNEYRAEIKESKSSPGAAEISAVMVRVRYFSSFVAMETARDMALLVSVSTSHNSACEIWCERYYNFNHFLSFGSNSKTAIQADNRFMALCVMSEHDRASHYSMNVDLHECKGTTEEGVRNVKYMLARTGAAAAAHALGVGPRPETEKKDPLSNDVLQALSKVACADKKWAEMLALATTDCKVLALAWEFVVGEAFLFPSRSDAESAIAFIEDTREMAPHEAADQLVDDSFFTNMQVFEFPPK